MTGSSKTASATTMVFPNLRDPSELRSEFNGKVKPGEEDPGIRYSYPGTWG